MRRLIVALLAALVLLGPAAAPSSADPTHSIKFSRDGQTWSDNLDAPLFDPSIRWVPGDVRQVQFYVRNERPDLDTGVLSLAVLDTARDALRESRYLRVAARVGAGPWHSVTAPGHQTLINDRTLRAAQSMRVQVRVRFLPEATNGTMTLPTDLGFRAVLSDASAVLGENETSGDIGSDGNGADGNGAAGVTTGIEPGPTGSTDTGGVAIIGSDGSLGTDGSLQADGGDDLPATGPMVPGWATPFAVLMVALGAGLLARRGGPRQGEVRRG